MAATAILFLFATSVALADENFERQVVAPYLEVRSPDGTGSGVVIDWKGEQLVLTAAHVTEGYKEVELYKEMDGGEMKSTWVGDVVWEGSPEGDFPDLALVRPRAKLNLPSANFDPSIRIERGEDVWVVGTHSGIHGSLEKTTVNRPSYRVEDERNSRSYTLVNGNPWYGNSGGPIYVKREGDYFMVGIVVRLAALNPRTPIACEKLDAVAKVLAEFTGEPQKKEPAAPDDKDPLDPSVKAKLALLYPAIKDRPASAESHPLVGRWVLTWNGYDQDCRFDADGTYECRRCHGAKWWADGDLVWFTEQHGSNTFAMAFDLESGFGVGWFTTVECGQTVLRDYTVPVKMTRMEPLPVMPRVVE